MPERDPRTDPRPGDVLYNKFCESYRRVTRILGARVEYVLFFDASDIAADGPAFQDYNAPWSWGNWADTAEVVEQGPDA